MSASLGVGSIVAGAYRTVRKLGQGGMGSVWVVEQINTRKQRAMKVMLPELAGDAGFRERFTQEAQVGARIESEHVVEVVDAGIDDATGAPFLVMELLEGEDLAARLAREQALPFADVQAILGQLTHALHAAHVAGIVHRDLKPENVFIARARRVGAAYTVKVLDFGIAKVVKESRTAATLTAAIGTPLWMPPEQTESSARITPAADVWPLGLLAFRMLTGRYYWSEAYAPGAHVTAILTEVLIRPIVPASERASAYGVAHLLPAGFDAWFARCVDRDPSQRFQTAGDAYAALLPVLTPGVDVAQSASWTMLAPRASATQLASPAELPVFTRGGASPATSAPIGRGTTSPQLLSSPGTTTRARPPNGAFFGVAAIVGAALLGVGGWKLVGRRSSPAAASSSAAAPRPDTEAAPSNRWIRIEGAKIDAARPWLLGLDRDDELPTTRGLRPARQIAAPSSAFELQQHEVSWDELEPFLDANASSKFPLPASVPPEPTKRAKLPATAVPYATASAYCKSLGGALPSEEQWEYAARGAERRRFPWGDAQIDLARTRAFAGNAATPLAVMTSEQDQTPGGPDRAIYDLAGNAPEWTASEWRSDFDGADESWASDGAQVFRAVRGLPLRVSYGETALVASATAAWRTPVCASGGCAVGGAGGRGKLALELAFVAASATGQPDAGVAAADGGPGADPSMVARTTIAKLLFDPGARADLQKCLETAAPEGLRDGVAIDVRWSRPVRPYPSCAWDDGSGGADDCCSTGGSGCHLEKLEALKIESAALAHATFFAADSPPSACVAKVVTDRLPTDAFKWEGAAGSTRVVVVVRWIGARPSAEASLVGFRCARTAK